MSRRNRFDQAPIGHTCPLIDEAQGDLDAVHEFLDSVSWGEDEVGLALAVEAGQAIERLQHANKFLLEKIRKANETLREWGNAKYYDHEQAQEKLDELERAG